MNKKGDAEYFVIPAGGARYIQGESSYEDEISLSDLIRVLVKRKKLFFGVLALVLGMALVWILLSEPVYESRSVLLIGQVAPIGQFETVPTLVQRLKEEYKVDDNSEGRRVYPIVARVAPADKGTVNAIEVVVRAHTASQAQAFLKGVVAKILQQHKRLYDIGLSQQGDLLESMEARRTQLQAALSEARRRLIASHQDAAGSGLLSLETDQLADQLSEVDQAIINQRIATSELQSRETTVIREATLPEGPVKPKPVLYLVIAVLLGLVAGVLAVFLAEFWSRLDYSDVAS
jgi:uncharacterized protein involved in exopolysaccharide biosynthesis